MTRNLAIVGLGRWGQLRYWGSKVKTTMQNRKHRTEGKKKFNRTDQTAALNVLTIECSYTPTVRFRASMAPKEASVSKHGPARLACLLVDHTSLFQNYEHASRRLATSLHPNANRAKRITWRTAFVTWLKGLCREQNLSQCTAETKRTLWHYQNLHKDDYLFS